MRSHVVVELLERGAALAQGLHLGLELGLVVVALGLIFVAVRLSVMVGVGEGVGGVGKVEVVTVVGRRRVGGGAHLLVGEGKVVEGCVGGARGRGWGGFTAKSGSEGGGGGEGGRREGPGWGLCRERRSSHIGDSAPLQAMDRANRLVYQGRTMQCHICPRGRKGRGKEGGVASA